jgi:hypothetical protein
VQFGLLARLTWWEYSWDIMEPITYFVTYGTSMGGSPSLSLHTLSLCLSILSLYVMLFLSMCLSLSVSPYSLSLCDSRSFYVSLSLAFAHSILISSSFFSHSLPSSLYSLHCPVAMAYYVVTREDYSNPTLAERAYAKNFHRVRCHLLSLICLVSLCPLSVI